MSETRRILSYSAVPIEEREDLDDSQKVFKKRSIFVADVGEESGLVKLAIPNWSRRDFVEFPYYAFPKDLRGVLISGKTFHAPVNELVSSLKPVDLYIDLSDGQYEIN